MYTPSSSSSHHDADLYRLWVALKYPLWGMRVAGKRDKGKVVGGLTYFVTQIPIRESHVVP